MGGRIRVKICCIATRDEARMAVAAGADALGLVAEMPSGPGPIPDAAIADIAVAVPPPVATFLLTSRTGPEQVVEHVQRCKTNVVQLVDAVPTETYRQLRAALPALRIVQVIHVQTEQNIDEARVAAEHVDALLLDSGNPSAIKKTLGGTGNAHDWDLSAQIVAKVDLPVFLAGGLNEQNVGQAIAKVRPYGVDLCSSVRTNRNLDDGKLTRFIAAVQAP